IERWLGDEPVAAYRESFFARTGRWVRKHPARTATVGALLLTGVIALGISTLLIGQEQRKTAEALRNEEQARRDRALAQVDALLNATPKAVPTILAGLASYREQIRPRLVEVRQQAEPRGATEVARKQWQQHCTRAALALLPEDAEQLAFLKERMLAEDTEPEETLLLRDQSALSGGKELAKDLWTESSRRDGTAARRCRALVTLARLDPRNPRWKEAGRDVVGPLLAAEPLHAAVWSAGLRDVKEHLLPALTEAFGNRERPAERRL